MPPPLAITVRGMGPGCHAVPEIVSVDEPAPLTVVGLKLPVRVEFRLVAVRVTGESKPPAATTLTVVAPVATFDVPASMLMLIGLGVESSSNEGLGAGATGR